MLLFGSEFRSASCNSRTSGVFLDGSDTPCTTLELSTPLVIDASDCVDILGSCLPWYKNVRNLRSCINCILSESRNSSGLLIISEFFSKRFEFEVDLALKSTFDAECFFAFSLSKKAACADLLLLSLDFIEKSFSPLKISDASPDISSCIDFALKTLKESFFHDSRMPSISDDVNGITVSCLLVVSDDKICSVEVALGLFIPPVESVFFLRAA